MKSFDVHITRQVQEIVPVYIDTPQEAEAEVLRNHAEDDTVEVVEVVHNEEWTQVFEESDIWPLYDSEGGYLSRDL